jgi:hypothetical protein
MGNEERYTEAELASGLAYGNVLIRPEAADFRDLSVANDLGILPTDDPIVRMRAIQDWAISNGYAGGFPTFYEADFGQGLVYGAVLFKPGTAEFAN